MLTATKRLALPPAIVVGALLSVFPALRAPTPALASQTCPNEQLRQESRVDPATGQPYSDGLPECRAYEMVSPLDKGGSDIQANETQAESIPASVSGEAVGFMSQNAFAHAESYLNAGTGTAANSYVARRGSSGWLTSYALAPRTILAHPDPLRAPDGGPELATVANCGMTVINNATAGTDAVCAREVNGSWLATPQYENTTGGIYGNTLEGGSVPQYLGGSRSLSTVVFQSTGGRSKNGQFLPADSSTESGDGLYEVSGLGGASPLLRLVNVGNDGAEVGPSMSSRLGGISASNGEPITCATGSALTYGVSYQAISASGEVIFFTGCPSNTVGGVNTIYARIDGRETVAMSNPVPSQCNTCDPTPKSAAYEGAAENGSEMFFTTSQQLVNEDTDSTPDLYGYNLASPPGKNVVDLSKGGAGDLTRGSGANVRGVVRTSADGSHVFFVAGGVLTTIPNAQGQVAQPGADNLYAVATEDDETKFVADLCSDAGLSGVEADPQCPASLNSAIGLAGVNDRALWEDGPENARRLAQTTPSGRYLIFDTYGRLIASGPEADTNEAQQVYRYDFDTGELIRVSIGESSFLASHNGNTPGMNALIAAVPTEGVGAAGSMADINDWGRAISSDGSTVIFATPEQLQADDTDTGAQPSCSPGVSSATGCNLYVWHYKPGAPSENQGEVQMISPGNDASSSDTHFGAGAMSESGADIFFFTRSILVSQDTDQLIDLYDARIDGGFAAPVEPTTCEGTDGQESTCQGEGTVAPGALTPGGSATQAAGENLTPGGFKVFSNLEPQPAKKVSKIKILKVGSKSLSVSVPGKGVVSLSGVGLRTIKLSVRKTGTYNLTLSPTRREQAVVRNRTVTTRARVVFTPAAGTPSTASANVRLAATKKSRARK